MPSLGCFAVAVGTLVNLGCGAPLPPLAKDEAEKNCRAQAQAMSDAAVNGKWETMADATHPDVIREMGGRKKFLQELARFPDEMRTKYKMTLVDCRCGVPSDIIEHKGGMYSVVNAPLKFRTTDGKTFLGASAYVALSTDGGRTWKFVSGGGTKDADRVGIKKFLPDLPDDLVLPKGQPPLLVDE